MVNSLTCLLDKVNLSYAEYHRKKNALKPCARLLLEYFEKCYVDRVTDFAKCDISGLYTKPEKARGRLLTFEGMHGSGKTTQAKIFKEKKSEAVVVPRKNPDSLPNLLLKRVGYSNPFTDSFLWAAQIYSRVSDVDSSESNLLVSDRHTGSFLANQFYQFHKENFPPEQTRAFLLDLSSNLQHPDINFYFRLPTPLVGARMRLREESTGREPSDQNVDKLQVIYNEFERIHSTCDYLTFTIDATLELEDISARVLAIFDRYQKHQEK